MDEWKLIVEVLQKSKNRMKDFTESTPNSIHHVDSNFNIIDINKSALAALQSAQKDIRSKDDVLGKYFFDIYPFLKEEGRFEKFNHVLTTREDIVWEDSVTHPVMGVMHLEINAFSIENGLGIIATNITERKQAEQALRESEIFYNQAERIGKIGHWEWDPVKNRMISCSEQYAHIYEMTIDEVINTLSSFEKDLEDIHEDDREQYAQVTSSALEHKEGWEIEYRLITRTGKIAYVHELGEPVFNEHGTVIREFGILQDITERKKAEDALKTSELRFRSLIEQTTDAVFCYEFDAPIPIDLPIEEQVRLMYDSTLVECNEVCAKAYGDYQREDVIGRKLTDLFGTTPESLDRLFTELIHSSYQIVDGEGVEKLEDGTERYFLNNGHGVVEDGKLIRMWGTFREITERKQAEQALRESQTMYSQAERLGKIGHWEWDIVNHRIISCSEQYAHIFEMTIDDLINTLTSFEKDLEFIHEDDREHYNQVTKTAYERKEGWEIEYRLITRTGKLAYVHELGQPVLDKHGTVVREFGIVQDITERKTAREALRESEEHYRALFTQVPVGLYRTTPDGQILDMNPAMQEMVGFPDSETALDANAASMYLNLEDRTGWKALMERDNIVSDFEWQMQRRDGTVIWVKDTAQTVRDATGEVLYYEGSVEDITERKQAEVTLKHMATHDTLTDLPNRDLLNDRLTHAISLTSRDNNLLAILFLDLDGFKAINDAYGHSQGDWLLQLIAERIKGCVRESDTVARMGGDEFCILLEGVEHIEDILPVAEKIMQEVSEPFTIQSSEAFITSSIGISVFPADGKDADTLLQNADRAMYRSKDRGKNTYQFYSPEMETQMLEDLELKNQLRQAITQEELLLHYQPQVELRTGRVFGVEALLRWQHPTLGLLTPGSFLAQAEESGLIVPIGEWVLETACEQLRDWKKRGLPPVRLSVNISGSELRSKDLFERIEKILIRTGISPELLELELSENIVFQNMETAMLLLKEIKKLGVRLAIDDFGTGYSTLSHLAHFPFDTLKIDKHFAQHVTNSPKDAAIVKGIITITDALKLYVIAEGVEEKEQLELYDSLGCINIQGYIFSMAVTAEDIEPLLREGIKLP